MQEDILQVVDGQQDQGQVKIKEDILKVDDTGHTAEPGQNTGGDTPSWDTDIIIGW
jgi:hypothetical protein